MLLLCATPIGNLGDLTPRVREAFSACDAIYCEDTRRTLTLLNHCGVKKPLVSCHQHNESARAQEIVSRLRAGETIVYVSDAGMPGVSDPGAALIDACIANDLPYSVLPGASAALTAAVMSGLRPQPFTFYGFFPREAKERRALLDSLKAYDHLVIFYESPHRLVDAMEALLDGLGDLDAAVLRELTKLHEEARRGKLSALITHYTQTPPKGECVLTVLCQKATEQAEAGEIAAFLQRLLANGASVRDASAEAAKRYRIPKKQAYALALEIAKENE